MKSKKSFTLIELLVVIAVIAILAGMLLPALSAARESVKIANCISIQHQLYVGSSTYANDFAGMMPNMKTAEQGDVRTWNTPIIFDSNVDKVGRRCSYIYKTMFGNKYWVDNMIRCPSAPMIVPNSYMWTFWDPSFFSEDKDPIYPTVRKTTRWFIGMSYSFSAWNMKGVVYNTLETACPPLKIDDNPSWVYISEFQNANGVWGHSESQHNLRHTGENVVTELVNWHTNATFDFAVTYMDGATVRDAVKRPRTMSDTSFRNFGGTAYSHGDGSYHQSYAGLARDAQIYKSCQRYK